MYLTLCINAENREEGVENHSEGTQQKNTSSLHGGQIHSLTTEYSKTTKYV